MRVEDDEPQGARVSGEAQPTQGPQCPWWALHWLGMSRPSWPAFPLEVLHERFLTRAAHLSEIETRGEATSDAICLAELKKA